ncbi:MAG: cysteine peptidase family C39 domain-containing protein [Planctomycetota bacterium]
MVPAIRQESANLCGLAAVDSLASFHAVTLDAVALHALRSLATEEGLSGAELKACLEGAGFTCHVFKGTLDETPTGLIRHLKAGRPLLVMLGPEGKRHCALVAGHDPERHLVALADPATGHVATPEAIFLERWSQASHFTLLALPRLHQSPDP